LAAGEVVLSHAVHLENVGFHVNSGKVTLLGDGEDGFVLRVTQSVLRVEVSGRLGLRARLLRGSAGTLLRGVHDAPAALVKVEVIDTV
jgi:hypothetical protein